MENNATIGLHDNNQSSTHPEAAHPENLSLPADEKNYSRLDQLSQELEDLKQTIASDTSRLTQRITQLRKRMRWLTGGLIAAVVALGGTIALTAIPLWNQQTNLQNEHQQLTEQIRTLEEGGISAEEFQQLQEQLTSLNQRTQELSEQAQALVEQLPEVTSSQFETLQQQLQDLEQSIRDNLSRDNTLSQFYTLNETLQSILDNQSSATSSPELSNLSESNQPSQN